MPLPVGLLLPGGLLLLPGDGVASDTEHSHSLLAPPGLIILHVPVPPPYSGRRVQLAPEDLSVQSKVLGDERSQPAPATPGRAQ